jgi:AmpD protein
MKNGLLSPILLTCYDLIIKYNRDVDVKIDQKSGLMMQVDSKPSPHHDDRPLNTDIDMIVVHNISLPPGEFGGSHVQAFFCGQLDTSIHAYFQTIASLKVSPHLFIDRKGVITQFVPFTKRAWHAGVSQFEGRERCNDFSIGIELEGTDDLPYEIIQYQALARVIQSLMKTYPSIKRGRIKGHVDIAPDRKTDPGAAFDWVHLDNILDELT